MTPDELDNLRIFAVKLLDMAVDGDRGRGEDDPVYKAITEGRDFGAGYSSCGDLVHWLFFRLGVRSAWLNRAEHRGWKKEVNLGRIFWACPVSRPPREGERYEAGDVLGVWNQPTGEDAHVLVVKAHVGNLVYSYDYGQPGGAIRGRVLRYGMLGDRKLQRVTKFEQVMLDAKRRGESVEVTADDALAWLNGIPIARRVLRRGMRGEDVALVQKKLGGLVVDKHFGPATEKRVREFQRDAGLVADGVVGDATWTRLDP